MAGKISEDSPATTLVGVQYAGIQDGRNVRVPQSLFDVAFQPLDAFDTIALAEAYAPASAPDTIQTRGYTTAGDGGGALYKKAASEPSHAGKFSITLDDAVTVVWYEQVTFEVRAGNLADRATIAIGRDAGAAMSETANRVLAIGDNAYTLGEDAVGIIAIGDHVLDLDTPGNFNIAIGDSSLRKAGAAANRNIAIGSLAGRFLQSGSFNTYIGRNTGAANVSGNSSVGFGYQAAQTGNAPIGLDGQIAIVHDLSAPGVVGIGSEALRESNGDWGVGVGYQAGAKIKGGTRNVAVGYQALGTLDSLLSWDQYVIDDTDRSGTYDQSGTTISVSITGANAVVGKKVKIKFTTGGISDVTAEYLWLTVASAPDADSFTVTSPVALTASGDCEIDWVETAVVGEFGYRNTAIGPRSGYALLDGARNVFIGNEAGDSFGATSFDDRLIVQNDTSRRPLLAGDFSAGRVGINALNDDLTHQFSVRDTAGVLRFSIEGTQTAGPITRVQSTDASANAGPFFVLDRVSSSPAANDVIGSLRYTGRDSVGADTNYVDMYATILDPTNGSEDANLIIRTTINGSTSARLSIGAGIVLGAASGGDMGAGTLNLDNGLYRDGTQVVGARQTGWAAATGTATRTTFATGSVTVSELAERVKALLDDLTTHGLIGA